MKGPIPSLTGIRGVAAIWVASFHAFLVFNLPVTFWTPVIEHGWSGVDLFFVLSGFILMHAHGEDFRRLNKAALARFVRSRFVRVYPLNFVVLVAIVLFLDAGQGFSSIADKKQYFEAFIATASLVTVWLPRNLTLNEPVWSLSAEVMGYIVFPVLALALMRIRWLSALVAFTSFGALFIVRVLVHHAHVNQIYDGGALIRLFGSFIGGAALWRIRSLLPERWGGYASPFALLLIASIAVCSMSYNWSEALPVLYGLVILCLSFRCGVVDRILSLRVSRFLGAISFPLYLTHLSIMIWLVRTFPASDLSSRWLLAAVSGLMTLLVAAALHRGVELPVQRFGRRRRRLGVIPAPDKSDSGASATRGVCDS